MSLRLCLLLSLAVCGPISAWALDYDIELTVPAAQRAMLETHLDLYRWRGSERLDETQLRRLVRLAPTQIADFLATEGYYSPKISTSLQPSVEGPWQVRLVVEPGEPVRVNDVLLAVTGPFDDGSAENHARLAAMRGNWSLRAGAVFRHADWEAAKREALRALLLDRYPAARIADSRATVDPDTRQASLRLLLDSGPAFSLGALQIEGLQRYPASLVHRLNPIRPGEPYSQAKLLELQGRLQDSPYFASADVRVTTEDARGGEVPVQVTLTENPARQLGFGAGLSTDTGLRGQVDYRDLNLFDRAWRLSSRLKLEEKRQSLGADLHFPLGAGGHQDSLHALSERTDIAGEVTEKLALAARRGRLHGRVETAIGLRYLFERQGLAGASGDQRSALVPSWSWIRRDVDNLLFPSQGHLVGLQLDGATRALLSDRDFLRGHLRAAWYRPLSERDRLILRGEFGAVAAKARDGIPSDYLFRTGGDQSVRGYAYQSLGLREGQAVVGGRWLAVASAEYVRWLTPQWGAALFVDAGAAADSLGALDPVQGYGLGARWKSPVGPIHLDLAWASETGQPRLHFTLGFSF